MSYSTIAIAAADQDLSKRVTSAIVQEGGELGQASNDYFWRVATAQDIEAAYASALAAGNPSPGGDEAVITDGMILGYVQANPPEPLP